MNIKPIGKIAKRYPFIGRALELGILSAVIYVLNVISTGDAFDKQIIISLIILPLAGGLTKYIRDLENN